MKEIVADDSGSTLLGLTLALLTLDLYRSNPVSLSIALFPVFVAGLPLLDAALAVVRRVRNGRSPLYGDRRHFYDLMLGGHSPRKVALVFYAVTVVLAATGSLALRSRPAPFLLAGALGVALPAAVAIRLGALRYVEQSPAPHETQLPFSPQTQAEGMERENAEFRGRNSV
jgi:hypothetical protein